MTLSSFFCCCLFLVTASLSAADNPFQKAEALRLQRPHFNWPETLPHSPELQARLDQLQTRPSAPFGFRPYLSRLLKDKDSPLTAEQKVSFTLAREKFAEEQSRLHDEWNSVRMEHMILGWQYAMATDAEVPALKAKLEQCLQLYLRCHADLDDSQDRQSRELWALLTREQQRQVIDFQWKQFARTEPGHDKDFASLKRFLKAVGPQDKATSKRLEEEAARWEKKHQTLLTEYQAGVDLIDRLRFYYDTTDQLLFHYALPHVLSQRSKFVSIEPEALRALYQLLDPARSTEWKEKANRAIADLRRTMLAKYSDKAPAMLKALGESPR